MNKTGSPTQDIIAPLSQHLSHLFQLEYFDSMASTMATDRLGKTLIDFASNGEFPDEAVSASVVENEALSAAVKALGETKHSLEVSLYNSQ